MRSKAQRQYEMVMCSDEELEYRIGIREINDGHDESGHIFPHPPTHERIGSIFRRAERNAFDHSYSTRS